MDRDSSAAVKDGTRTPKEHKHPGQRPVTCSVEVLTSYTHTSTSLDELQKTW